MLTQAAAMPWWAWPPLFFFACFAVFIALASEASWFGVASGSAEQD